MLWQYYFISIITLQYPQFFIKSCSVFITTIGKGFQPFDIPIAQRTSNEDRVTSKWQYTKTRN